VSTLGDVRARISTTQDEALCIFAIEASGCVMSTWISHLVFGLRPSRDISAEYKARPPRMKGESERPVDERGACS
jgi:hypothetical protein